MEARTRFLAYFSGLFDTNGLYFACVCDKQPVFMASQKVNLRLPLRAVATASSR